MNRRAELVQELYYALAVPGTQRWDAGFTPELQQRLGLYTRELITELTGEGPNALPAKLDQRTTDIALAAFVDTFGRPPASAQDQQWVNGYAHTLQAPVEKPE